MGRTPFPVSLIKVLHALNDGMPSCVSDIARRTDIHWKTVNKALDLLIDIDEILEGRIIRKQLIGCNKVYTIVEKPTIQHGNEIDFAMLFGIRSNLDDVLKTLNDEIFMTLIDGGAYAYESEDTDKMKTLLLKSINSINVAIEPSGFIEDDVFELHRIRQLINESFESDDHGLCDELLTGLISLFTGEWIAESSAGKKVKEEIRYMLSRTGRNTKVTLRRMRTIITKAIGKKCGV